MSFMEVLFYIWIGLCMHMQSIFGDGLSFIRKFILNRATCYSWISSYPLIDGLFLGVPWLFSLCICYNGTQPILDLLECTT
jgi:hypothetical protein